MSRWIVTSFALHLGMMAFLYVTAVRWKPRVDLNPRIAVELTAPPEQEPEPTVATPAPTVAKPKPTAPPTAKKTPKKNPTAKKPTPKRATPKPEKTVNRTALLERVMQSRQKFREVASEPPPEPPPVKPVPLPRPTAPPVRAKPGPQIQTRGLEQFKDNFYFALMSNLFYEYWQVPGRSSGEAIRSSVLSVVVLESGEIDLGSCRWVRKSGKPGFDDSVWECVKQTDLPPLPVEFRKSKIEVTVTFQDEV